MKKFKSVLRQGLTACVVAIALMCVSCVDVDVDFGSGFIPDGQEIEVLSTDIQWYTEQGDEAFEIRLYQTPSLKMSQAGSLIMGAQRDSIFGLRRAGFYSQYTPLYGADEDGFGLEPMLDSVMFYFNLWEFHGDTTERYTYEVREVLNDDFIRNSADTMFSIMSIDSLVEAGVLGEVAFEFDYPDLENAIDSYTDSVRADVITDAGYDLIYGLMLMEREDGSQVDYDIYNDNHEEFIESFKGLSIMPKAMDAAGDPYGATYGISISSSGFGFWGRSKYTEDTSLIVDTIGMSFVFYDSSLYDTDDEVDPGGVSINFVEQDYTYAQFDQSLIVTPDDTEILEQTADIYVEGATGVVTELSFTKAIFDFLESEIARVNEEQGQDYDEIFINVARLQLYVKELDSYTAVTDGVADYTNLVERYSTYPSRLGLYYNYGSLTDEDGDTELVAVSDYSYYYEIYYSITSDFGGTLYRGQGCYEMNIPLHMQGLWKMWREEVAEVGGDYNDVDWSSITWNKVYVAHLAENLLSARRVVLQGAPNEDGSFGAPLRLRLTYTLVKSK